MNQRFITLLTRFKGALILLLFITVGIQAQEDPILFSIGDQDVRTSEFLYIYNKNNAGNADFSEASVREYLDLYKKFKLKVHHARELKMDTIDRLNTELAGYRDQLAATYLNDNSVMGRLAREAYERMGTEAEVSHILIKLPKNQFQLDTSQAYKIASQVHESIVSGSVTFEDAAKSMSQDDKNKADGGYIGYIKALMPKGYYALETAIYNLVPGNISKPVRSPRGYHIVKLHSLRDAQPEVEVAHILVKKKKKATDNHEAARRRIADIHNRLVRGVPFEELASKESDDSQSARKGGRIGYVKTGEYDLEFEKAVLALTEDQQISEPVETRIGFHVLKRLGIKELKSFQDAKRGIENDLRRTERAAISRQVMIDRIKSEEELSINENARNKFFALIDDASFFTYRWIRPENIDDEAVISFKNGFSKTVIDFVKYIESHPKERVRLKPKRKTAALHELFNSFVNEACLELEKSQLEKKYPEFASLMREYEEGILLFEITKDHVWDKASADTAGLKNYFEQHRSDYVHPEKIDVVTFTITNSTEKQAKKIAKQIKKKSTAEIERLYPTIPQDAKSILRSDKDSARYAWKEGKLSSLRAIGENGNAFIISKTLKNTPPQPKELNECRGYVIADYQELLEKNWIEELNSKYKVKENSDAINAIINR